MKVTFYFAPPAAFAASGAEWEAVQTDGTLWFGWCNFEGDRKQQAAFEALPNVTNVGHILDPSPLPGNVAKKMSPHGVVASDTHWQAIHKMFDLFGGLTLERTLR